MALPISYNIRNLIERKTTTLLTALGIALPVAILLVVLALVAGLQEAFQASGSQQHVLVLRKGTNGVALQRSKTASRRPRSNWCRWSICRALMRPMA